jgi:protein-histidine N-methyltransferase
MSQPFSFSFSFAGDDIEETPPETPIPNLAPLQAAETGTFRKPSNTAFPISGQSLLPPLAHDLNDLLATLPSKIAYSTLHVTLDDGSELGIPRREWWDVRVQLMAEEHEAAEVGLGKDDIKTGVYEGGFKSWESSVDLVKVLARRRGTGHAGSQRVLEAGHMFCFNFFIFHFSLRALKFYDWNLADRSRWDAALLYQLWLFSNGS